MNVAIGHKLDALKESVLDDQQDLVRGIFAAHPGFDRHAGLARGSWRGWVYDLEQHDGRQIGMKTPSPHRARLGGTDKVRRQEKVQQPALPVRKRSREP